MNLTFRSWLLQIANVNNSVDTYLSTLNVISDHLQGYKNQVVDFSSITDIQILIDIRYYYHHDEKFKMLNLKSNRIYVMVLNYYIRYLNYIKKSKIYGNRPLTDRNVIDNMLKIYPSCCDVTKMNRFREDLLDKCIIDYIFTDDGEDVFVKKFTRSPKLEQLNILMVIIGVCKEFYAGKRNVKIHVFCPSVSDEARYCLQANSYMQYTLI